MDNLTFQILTIVCALAIFYSYLGYPVVLRFLIFKQRRRSKGLPLPTSIASPTSFAVIITARNESKVIAAKLENTLEMVDVYRATTGQDVQVIVASDGSNDGTNEIVSQYSDKGVVLVELDEPVGKENAMKNAVPLARGDVVVFTDAKVSLGSNTLVEFDNIFRDCTVGAVSSVDRIEGSSTQGSGEGFYVRYEMWLRRLESEFGSLVGLSGSCFAVRRPLAMDMRTDLPSDFSLLLATKRAGLKGIQGDRIICTYRAVDTEEEEYARKVRTVVRGIATLFAVSEVMSFEKHGLFAWQVVSHKLCRWLVPWFLVLMLCFSWFAATGSLVFTLFLYSNLALIALALWGFVLPDLRTRVIFKVPLFFFITNIAIAHAWCNFLMGKRTVSWDPSPRK